MRDWCPSRGLVVTFMPPWAAWNGGLLGCVPLPARPQRSGGLPAEVSFVG
jgi:hypothetical protein